MVVALTRVGLPLPSIELQPWYFQIMDDSIVLKKGRPERHMHPWPRLFKPLSPSVRGRRTTEEGAVGGWATKVCPPAEDKRQEARTAH